MLVTVLTYLLVGGFIRNRHLPIPRHLSRPCTRYYDLKSRGEFLRDMSPLTRDLGNIVAFLASWNSDSFCNPGLLAESLCNEEREGGQAKLRGRAGINILLTVALTYVGLIARAASADGAGAKNEHAEMMVLRTFTELVPPEFQIVKVIAFFAAILSTSDTYSFC